MQAVSECDGNIPSFTKRHYPCWVIPLTALLDYDELPVHESCIEKLDELLPDSISPSCAYSFFISQNWEGGRPGPPGQGYYNVRGLPHPDNKLNTKLRWLKRCALAFLNQSGSEGSPSVLAESQDASRHHPTPRAQDQATHEAATRSPDMDLVRSPLDPAAIARPADQGD